TRQTICGLVAKGCYTHFGTKSIYYTQGTGAHVVAGRIRGRWQEMGWEKSRLGYPTSSERCGLIRGGCFSNFQNGKIHWSPKSGAWPTWGAIQNAWAKDQYERGKLGYPTSMERHSGRGAPENHRIQNFEYGFLYWDGKNVTGEWTDPGCPSCRVERRVMPR
ncbi:MAG: hypothetical protein L0G99_16460, partial [Propionibacteriales bacterium]|nr:hypothetical protein [Propionibacteriales bacterium]